MFSEIYSKFVSLYTELFIEITVPENHESDNFFKKIITT